MKCIYLKRKSHPPHSPECKSIICQRQKAKVKMEAGKRQKEMLHRAASSHSDLEPTPRLILQSKEGSQLSPGWEDTVKGFRKPGAWGRVP